MGFRVAHKNALKERQTRVVVIKKGDIGNIDHIQFDLRAYLRANIYIQWDTKGFFKKLKFAIAHPQYYESNVKSDIEQV